MNKRIWVWEWQQGGYNWCYANTRQEALEWAKALAGATVLKVDESTLHVGDRAEVNQLDRQYASACA